MSLLFNDRPTGAEVRKLSASQRLVMMVINNLRQLVASLGEMWRTPSASLMTIAVSRPQLDTASDLACTGQERATGQQQF